MVPRGTLCEQAGGSGRDANGSWFGVFSEPARLDVCVCGGGGVGVDIGSIQGEVAGQKRWGQGEARTGGWVGPEARGRPGHRQHLGHISSKHVQHGPSLAVNVQCFECVLGGLPAAVDAEARRSYAPPGRACWAMQSHGGPPPGRACRSCCGLGRLRMLVQLQQLKPL